MSEEIFDTVIIGGGPAGLSAAQYAARAGLSTLVLDKSATAGALAFTSKIENYPGTDGPLSGTELLGRFKEQAGRFGAKIIDDIQVIGVNLGVEVKEVFTMDRSFKAKTVIIATGSMGRKASIDGEAEFLGRGVSYCAICDAAFFKEKTVCVIGDSEEAAKEAGMLSKFAKTVYLIGPHKKLKVPGDYPSLAAKNLKVITGTRVIAIEGTDTVERIKLKNLDGEPGELALSGVFVYLHGNKPVVDYLAGALDADGEGSITVGPLMETSIPGVFAAGDLVSEGVRQVVVAASSGCLAALGADKYVSHRTKARTDWRH